MSIMDIQQVAEVLKGESVSTEASFSVMKALCFYVGRTQTEYDSVIQELVLRALDKKAEFSGYIDVLNSLVVGLGLFPYLDESTISAKDAMALEMHKPENLYPDPVEGSTLPIAQRGYIFHKVQAEVFSRLLGGESVVLSAPTSFGKSAIVDALIESGKFNNIVIVVPTIALIDETRRRLSRYRDTHKVITHSSQGQAERNIFVFTQERVVDCQYFPELDLFVLDEFYKLNPDVDKERSATLNHAFYRLTKRSKQFYLLGPNIQAIPDGFPERFRCLFYRTDYSTVVTELVRIPSERSQELEELMRLCDSLEGPTLIFCGSPNKARKIVNALLESGIQSGDGVMDEASDWISDNYDPEWTLAKSLRFGIGIHHGRMPRALAQMVVRGFNDEKLKFLVCTSTLIEGVNTKAKNVIIFDNKIGTKKYDYFTFNNIRGRSGRMFEHFIGKVFIFHDAPQEDLPFVDVPVFSQDAKNTPESLLIQMDEGDLHDASRRRLEPFSQQNLLSLETLRANIGVEPHLQINLARDMQRDRDFVQRLDWSGLPTYEQAKALCVAIWDYFMPGGMVGGVTSGPQLAFRINMLRSNTLKDLIKAEQNSVDSADDAVESVLDFIRQWPQYRFGKFASAINRIQADIASKLGMKIGDYSYFTSKVENLFSDPVLTALDEYGVPFPLAKKLETHLATDGNLDLALDRLRSIGLNELNVSPFEASVLEYAKLYL